MIDTETFNTLQSAVLKRLENMFAEEEGIQKFAHEIAKIATVASIITLQEYEKMKGS